jgi:hypothetical protein
MTCYISGDNKKAYDYLTGIGYTLTKTTKTYHKRNKPIGQGIIYLVNWDKSKKEFDQLLINVFDPLKNATTAITPNNHQRRGIMLLKNIKLIKSNNTK